MAVESEQVQQVMTWLAQDGHARTANVNAETLVQTLAVVVFQGDAQWPERPDRVDAYRDALSGWLGTDESAFAELTKPGAEPDVFIDWFQQLVVGWESAAAQQGRQSDPGAAAGAPGGGTAAGTANPNFDGTAGTEFYRFDQAAQEYQYSSSADAGGDWAAYDKRRYSEPAKDDSYGLTYRYDHKDNVYAWYDEPGQTWRDQAWADQQHAAGGQGAASAQPARSPAAGSSAGPAPAWDENWKMFYRVDSGGGYEFADAVTPGDESSGCGNKWLSQEQAAARGTGHRQTAASTPTPELHAAAADTVHDALRAAVESAFAAHPELRDVLTDEHIKAVLADAAQEVIG